MCAVSTLGDTLMESPTVKKILILNAHPREASLTAGLVEAYAKGAESGGAEVSHLDLKDLEIDWVRYPWGREQQLEPDVIRSQELISAADHIVLAFPVFWGLYPALLKGFIDRVFLPGFAFKAKAGAALPEKLLSGRTARLIYTMDAPGIFHRFWYGLCVERALERATFWYVGIKPIGRLSFHGTKGLNEAKAKSWMVKAEQAGRNDATRLHPMNSTAKRTSLVSES